MCPYLKKITCFQVFKQQYANGSVFNHKPKNTREKKKTYFFFPFKQQSRHQTHYLTLNPCECPSKNPKPSQSVDPEKALIAYCFRIQVPYMWFQGEKKNWKGKMLITSWCYNNNASNCMLQDKWERFYSWRFTSKFSYQDW